MSQNEALKAIMVRRSVRAYKSAPVPEELLAAILEAGQAAPYVTPDSRHFSVLQDRDLIHRLNEDAKIEGMKISDLHRELFSAPGFDGTYGAPTVIVLSGNESTVQYESVCAASVQNMLIAAQSLELASCWAYYPIFVFHGAEAAKWLAKLRVPGGYKPCAAVLLGYGLEGSSEEPDKQYKNSVTFV